MMMRVIIESPYAGQVIRNLTYLRAAMADCLSKGEAPFASHALYTQDGVLDDTKPIERLKGMQAGQAWYEVAKRCIVYTDLGISDGMKRGIETASKVGLIIEFRSLEGWS